MSPGLPDHEPIAPGVDLDDAALSFTFSRSGGPGGQNVNKVNSRATLTLRFDALTDALPPDALDRLRRLASAHLATDPERLVIHAASSRSQLANRRACVAKLRRLLTQAMHRPRVRRPTRPSRAARQRRLDAKKHRAQIKAARRRPD
ncbi:MAG: alternative ribosome rescue aminoacyl-tRNA hydrolase ArfB [Planctomycetota bacterium]